MGGRQDTGTPRRGATAADRPAAPVEAPRTAPLIPTQVGHTLSGPVPVVPARTSDVPQPHEPVVAVPSPDSEVAAPAPDAARARTTHRRQVVALLTAAAVLVSAGGVWAVQQERAARAEAVRAAQSRVDAVTTGLAAELAAGRADGVVTGAAVSTTQRAAAGEQGRAALEHAGATLASTPQAGDGPRGELQRAIDAASGALQATAVSLTTLRTTTGALAAPEQVVVDAQAAWQAAEDARIAAEEAARAAAAQAAAARAAKAPTPRRAAAAPAAAGGGGASDGAPAAAAAGLPLAGSEGSAGAVGAALNAHRVANGLGELSIVRSGARVEHAMQMAASDSIWHSGTRAGSAKARPEIVGRVSPGDASRMINAYANSSSHNEQMLGGYSTAYIGVVMNDGWMYTSITFG
ncbi:hypothetical protein [Cellulomonas sp. B6]|jgi:hypothetical protein|uniref:CAP domain-containing protein n=1 Tax=Cellulomonas sp. B6 TaxID=1295626 RepID=UPI00073B1F38|nr:hypothetical protein [Cellulomonas sp. B6]KSW14013.1 hypothetical protein ATM99_03045 [Cellulomonas sp. B6]